MIARGRCHTWFKHIIMYTVKSRVCPYTYIKLWVYLFTFDSISVSLIAAEALNLSNDPFLCDCKTNQVLRNRESYLNTWGSIFERRKLYHKIPHTRGYFVATWRLSIVCESAIAIPSRGFIYIFTGVTNIMKACSSNYILFVRLCTICQT